MMDDSHHPHKEFYESNDVLDLESVDMKNTLDICEEMMMMTYSYKFEINSPTDVQSNAMQSGLIRSLTLSGLGFF